MYYLILLITVLLAICFILNTVYEKKPIEVSKHTENITPEMIFAVFKSFKIFEGKYNASIVYLLNNSIVTKSEIEKEADNIMFSFGEFPAEQLEIDPRDFNRLVRVHDEYLNQANDLQIKFLIRTLY